MSETPLHALSLIRAIADIASGKLTARSLADAQLARIAATDATIDAWAQLDPDRVRVSASQCDAHPGGARGPLHGAGVGVKDIVATAEYPTEMGTPAFLGNRPASDAECIARLRRASGYVFGKTVTTELAFLHPGKTRNPWNPEHTPAGSSSGSAAAVAAGHIAAAIGTQTNGSVIRPAAFCGVVGFKPTKGAIPYAGTNVFSQTLDQIGTFGRNVADAALLAGAIADPDKIAMATSPCEAAPTLALLRQYPWTRTTDPAATEALEATAVRLAQLGAKVITVDFPEQWKDADRVHRTIMFHEGAMNLRELQVRARAGLSDTLNSALDEGSAVTPGDYETALRKRDQAIAFFTEWLIPWDAILSPPAPGPAPRGLSSTGDPSCCTLWSLTGFPAITIPVGRAANGMPLGLQLASIAGDDDALVATTRWCEARLPFAGLV